MSRPRGFKSMFSSMYLVPSDLHQALIKCLNNVQLTDLHRLNKDGENEKLTSISGAESNAGSVPPIIIPEEGKTAEPFIEKDVNDSSIQESVLNNIIDKTSETEKKTQDVSTETEKTTQDVATETEKTTQDVSTGTEKTTTDVSTGTDITTKDASSQSDFQEIQRCEVCSGMFYGSNNLLDHMKVFHDIKQDRKRKNIKLTDTMKKSKQRGIKRKLENDENNGELNKKRETRNVMKQKPSSEHNLKIKVDNVGKEQIHESKKITNIKKGRSKEDLQTGKGLLQIFAPKSRKVSFRNI